MAVMVASPTTAVAVPTTDSSMHGFEDDDGMGGGGISDMMIAHLTRAYDTLTGEKRRYRMLQERELRRKTRQCETYGQEKRQLAMDLDLMSKGVLVRRDSELFKRVQDRLQLIQTIRHQIEDAQQNVRRNRERLRAVGDQVAQTRRAMGGTEPLFVWRFSAQRKVERVKIRMKRTVQIADLQSSERGKLRGRLGEEMALRKLYKGQLVKSLDSVESNNNKVNTLVDESTQAFEDLNRLQHRYHHLHDRQRIETQRLYQRIKDVERQLNSDSKLHNFLDLKNRHRVETLSGGGSGGLDGDDQAAPANVTGGSGSKLSQAFRARDINPEALDLLVAHLKHLTHESNSSNMIRKFQDREANVWSTLTYVSVASKEADRLTMLVDQMLEDEKSLVRELIAAEELNARTHESNQKMLIYKADALDMRQTQTDERKATVINEYQQSLKDLCETLVRARPRPFQSLPLPQAAKSTIRRVNEDITVRECVEETIGPANFEEFMAQCERELLDLRNRYDCLLSMASHKHVQLLDDDDAVVSNRRASVLRHNMHMSFEAQHAAAAVTDAKNAEANKILYQMQPPRLDDDLGRALLKEFGIEEEQVLDEDAEFGAPALAGTSIRRSGGHTASSPRRHESGISLLSSEQQPPVEEANQHSTANSTEQRKPEGSVAPSSVPPEE